LALFRRRAARFIALRPVGSGCSGVCGRCGEDLFAAEFFQIVSGVGGGRTVDGLVAGAYPRGDIGGR